MRSNSWRVLNEARVARNALAHRGAAPSIKDYKAAIDAAFQLLIVVIDTDDQEEKIMQLTKAIVSTHDPVGGPIDLQYWREIPAVPGDRTWGDKDYPRYPEIELKPVGGSKRG